MAVSLFHHFLLLRFTRGLLSRHIDLLIVYAMLAVSFTQYPGASLAVLARLNQVSCGYWEFRTWIFCQHVSRRKIAIVLILEFKIILQVMFWFSLWLYCGVDRPWELQMFHSLRGSPTSAISFLPAAANYFPTDSCAEHD